MGIGPGTLNDVPSSPMVDAPDRLSIPSKPGFFQGCSPVPDRPRHAAAASASCLLTVLAALLAHVPRAGAQEVRYQAKITNANRVGLTVTNYGFLGNNFTSRSPSL